MELNEYLKKTNEMTFIYEWASSFYALDNLFLSKIINFDLKYSENSEENSDNPKKLRKNTGK